MSILRYMGAVTEAFGIIQSKGSDVYRLIRAGWWLVGRWLVLDVSGIVSANHIK